MTEQYFAYLIRLWLKKRNNEFAWRVYLENIHTSEHHIFASIDALLLFLGEQGETGQETTQMDRSGQETSDRNTKDPRK